MFPSGRPAAVLAAVAVAGAVVAGAAGCGSSGHASMLKTSGSLSDTSAGQILTTALADFGAAPAVRAAGTVVDSGQTFGVSVAQVKDKGCTGRMTVSGLGSFQLVSLHGTAWIKPSDEFYKSQGGAALLPLLAGKWLALTKGTDLGSLTRLCSPGTLAGTIASAPRTGLRKSAGPAIGGQPTVEVTSAAAHATMYVTDSVTPQILRITGSGPESADRLDFSGYDTPAAIAAPPAADTVDGRQYGF